MNVWIPGLIVVAVGLAAGVWFAFRGKRDGAGEAASAPSLAGGGLSATGASTANVANAATAGAAPGASARRSGLLGFLSGVATCLIIGSLIYWATTGARPKEEMGAGGAGAAPMGSMPPQGAVTPEAAAAAHDESAALTPEVKELLDQLRSKVKAAPQDLNSRRQLTVALLNANQLMEAFEQAKEVQKQAPNDPDGMFVEGVVRLAMGQWPLAVQLMDGVLAQHPDHVLAAMAKGQAEAALGQTPQAIETWKKGLAAAGGKFPPIEELLAEAEAGAGPSVFGGAPAPASPASSESEGDGSGFYRVHIELAPGTVATPGVGGNAPTLFVALRGDAPGPPAAVKRISNPTFPLELSLSADDSMMGQPLPAKGSLSIHLDGDGNASTKEAGDLTAAVQAFSGTPVTVILENARN